MPSIVCEEHWNKIWGAPGSHGRIRGHEPCIVCGKPSNFITPFSIVDPTAYAEGLRQEKEEKSVNETVAAGAWIVYSYDNGPYPVYLADNELDALRHAVGKGYDRVKFWEFGTEWENTP